MIYALIVVYNKRIDNSITFKCMQSREDKIKIIIFDNSNKEYLDYNKKYCKDNNITYYTFGKNVGLSISYNYIVDRIEKNKENYIIMLDDDTKLNDSYFEEIYSCINKNEYDILLPIVYSNNRMISPSNVQRNCRIKIINKKEDINLNKITAINTAMVIRTTVFNKIKYNDNLFLDYIDHDFMKKVRNNNYGVKVLNSEINQSFSRFQKNDINSEITRFKIFIKDFRVYCKCCNNLLFYYLSLFKYRIHECIKYKSLKFLIIK